MITRIKQLIDRLLLGSSFMKAVSTLLSGTLLAMFISYLAQPILTRLYTPEAFGLFDTFVSLVALLMPFASLRYEDAIMLPEDDEEALGILGLSFLLVIIVSGLSLGLTFFEGAVTSWFNNPGLAMCLIWVAPALLALRFAKLSELWLNRRKQYAAISAGQIAQTSTMASLRIGLSKFTATHLPFGLIWGYMAGYFASATLYAVKIIRTQKALWRDMLSGSNIRQAASRYIHFPKYSLPSTFLITLQSKLPVILLLFFFDEATVGYFGRAFALFAVPLSLLGNAISQVFFVEGAEARRNDTLAQLTDKVHNRLITLGLFPTLAVIITGPQVMEFFLGEGWEQAGIYLQLLAPWFFFASIASPLTRLFDIMEEQRLDFITSILIFVIQTGLFVYGCYTGDTVLALIYLSVGGVIARLVHVVVTLKLSGISFASAIKPYRRQLLLSLPFLAILYAVQLLAIGWLTALALAVTGIGFLLVVYKDLIG